MRDGGPDVGSVVGGLVGWTWGASVGRGVAVSAADGRCVGSAVGRCEGRGVGRGDAVGAWDGEWVGSRVGSSVGGHSRERSRAGKAPRTERRSGIPGRRRRGPQRGGECRRPSRCAILSTARGAAVPLSLTHRSSVAALPLLQGDSSYWLHELSYSSLESNDSGNTQQPWLPDELCGHCMLCQQRFHLWRWTHHCRDCGG